MLKESFGSVKVLWLDREGVKIAVKQAVRRLARTHPEIIQAILFGSLARGDAVPGSDADVMLTLTESETPFLDRIPKYTVLGVPVGVDVFPYTRKELARMLNENNSFVKQALAEGTVIYKRRRKAAAP